MTEPQRVELLELAKLVTFNIPNRLNPDAFHVTKSDIAERLRRLARQQESGR